MKVRIRDMRMSLDYDSREVIKEAARHLGIDKEHISGFKLVRQAIDARRRKVFFTLTVELEFIEGVSLPQKIFTHPNISRVEEQNKPQLLPGSRLLNHSPLIVGSGPAGLFCALYLARHGYQPVIIEQGQDIERRVKSTQRFWREGHINPLSNAQFGEGGAGAFSDGKLTTRIDDERIDYVINAFVQHGAADEIRYLKKPHVGTDVIREVVKSMRREIIARGGEIYFDACLTDIIVNQMSIQSIIINNRLQLPCSLMVLAVGNSARDVYRMLDQKGVGMKAKPFALGVRVEHPQGIIDKIQYGEYAGHPRLESADYHFTYQDKEAGRSLYTFCMCPGGYVIGAASGEQQVVTNGMSHYARDSGIANSALVVTVKPADWGHTVLGGIKLQEKLERQAFFMGGGNYRAPAQLLKDFIRQKPTLSLHDSLATYSQGVSPSNLWELLPGDIGEVLYRGLLSWEKRIKGFIIDDAVLTGVETRTSAPLRIERNRELCSVSLMNMYPCGEGAGYAGGIVSSAVDGLKVAEQIICCYNKPVRKIEIKDHGVTSARDL